MKQSEIQKKIVLGTAQLGMNYGIANIFGKPAKQDAFKILEFAWEKGVRRFDTAPGYGSSEKLLGEFIVANGIQDDVIVLTKIPSLKKTSNFQICINNYLKSSLENLRCPINILFFHDPLDSNLLSTESKFFENLLVENPVSTLGISVYETSEIKKLQRSCYFDLAYQFPFNVIDRRFEDLNITSNKCFARSVLLQGLLASKNSLIQSSPKELISIQKKYHSKLNKHQLDPVRFAISFVNLNDYIDYFLIGVDTKKHIEHLLDLDLYSKKDIAIIDSLRFKFNKYWLDPRNWSSK